jgi:poly(3-hydroxybutyrate) depolymerase
VGRSARIGLLAAVALQAHAAAAHAVSEPLTELGAGCEARQSSDARPVAYRICSGKVASFDGTQLDATLTLPARQRGRKRLPLVVMLHGLFGSKNEHISQTRAGDGADRGTEAYKTLRWNNVWFAARGYAVLTYSARAHGESGGELGLAHRQVEVRDTRHLVGLLADEALERAPLVRVARRRVGVAGGSYGGGQAWLLLTTRENDSLPYGTWATPRGRRVRLAAVVPSFTWSDLLYTLAPNGRQLSGSVVDPATANQPFGVGKQTLIDGFVAQGGNKLTPEIYRWLARFNAGEPYDNGDPVVAEARQGLMQERSAYYQDGFFEALRGGRQRRIPVFAAQGWTDPIFHAIESLRMYQRLRQVSPKYPIGLYFGDFEHLTTLNKHADFRRWHLLGNRFLDRYLKPTRRRVLRHRLRVETAVTNCDPQSFGPIWRARRWAGLTAGSVTFELSGGQQTASPLSDQRAAGTDPVLRSLAGRGCITTDAPVAPGVASWRLPAGNGFTLIGMPRLHLRVRAAGTDLELNSRLWDVAPDGTQTLVSRGAYRVVAPNAAGEEVDYELFGNAWSFGAGHQLLLELTQDDSPYFRRDNFPSSAAIDGGTLTVPTREPR